MPAALSAWIGGVALFQSWLFLPRITAIAGLALLIAFSSRKKFFIALFLIAGFSYALLRYAPPMEYHAAEAVIKGVAAPAVRGENGYSQVFRVSSLRWTGGQQAPSGAPPFREIRLFPREPLKEGVLYTLKAGVIPPEKLLNPGFDNSYARPSGKITCIVSSGRAGIIERTRARLDRFYLGSLSPRNAAFVMSITTGERALLDQALWSDFSKAGLAHLISISGTHFGIFSLLVFTLMQWALRLLPLGAVERLTLYASPSQIGAALSFPFLLVYLLISGMDVPALRSFIMMGLFLTGLLIGREKAWLNSLLFAALVILLWQPEALTDVSFQLSFLAVFFIGVAADHKKEKQAGEKGKGTFITIFFRKHILEALLLTIIITLGLLPLTACRFHNASIIAPAANLAVVPVVGFLLVPLSMLEGFIYLASGWRVLPVLPDRLSTFSLWLTNLFASMPHAWTAVPAFPPGLLLVFYACAAFYFVLKKKRYLLVSLVPFLVWGGLHYHDGPLNITFLDVGTGESSVIGLPGGKTFVLDTGAGGYEAARFLNYEGKTGVDALVLSHSHGDHTGGAPYILSHFNVKEVWDNGRLVYDKGTFGGIGGKTKKLSRGDVLDGNGCRMTVLHPYDGFETVDGADYVSANNNSLVLRFEDGYGHSALFTGDIEREAQEDLLSLSGQLKSNVYKVPHHGSKTSSWMPFINAVSPEIAVIMPGRDNSFGHPHIETLRALAGAKIFRTDRDGAVKVEMGAGGITVSTYASRMMKEAPRTFTEEMHNLRMLFSSW
ncbi:MAG: DNA internalization-related competence protein ComEC/Rec2 [Nitrospiraceae bacterium]|nr:DNA internalization-related competence protein ComEC/Rec2 [Nitrospiraceae bacterium]